MNLDQMPILALAK